MNEMWKLFVFFFVFTHEYFSCKQYYLSFLSEYRVFSLKKILRSLSNECMVLKETIIYIVEKN